MGRRIQCAPRRNLSFDVINILSCLAVIALHHNGLVHSFQDTPAWRQSLVVECAFYWAVPVFLMLSGANLLNYRQKYSTRTFMVKRFSRTLIPFLFWSIVFLVWKVATGQVTLEPPLLRDALSMIFNYKVMEVYWFFGPLFAAYLAMPVFSLLVDHRETLWYIVGLNFVFRGCLLVLKQVFSIKWSLDIPLLGNMTIYILLGYLLSTTELSVLLRISIYLLGISGFFFRFRLTLLFSIADGTTFTAIKGYDLFHSVFLAVAVFVFLTHVPWNRILPKAVQGVLPSLSACSFGVFLIHRFVMYYEQQLLGLRDTRFLWRIPCVLLTYVVSLVIVWLIRRIPVVKRVVG